MEVFQGPWSNFLDFRDSAITVGSFDGIHLGHQQILNRLVEGAKAQRLRSVVVTFEPHPRLVLTDSREPIHLLTPTEEKLELLRNWPLDLVCVLRFDKTASELSPRDFVQIVLKGRMGLKRIVIGYNHAFGKNRGGDRESLIAFSREMDFQVDTLNPVEVDGLIVSSSIIRGLLKEGEVALAAALLGRRYSLAGKVVPGAARGKRLKFPTANLAVSNTTKLLPADGVYCGLVRRQGYLLPAAVSIGVNPTFPGAKRTVEAHIIGFDGDLYGQNLEIQLVQWIRSERKFASESELSEQIAQDVNRSLSILESSDLLNKACGECQA
ncbi:MAG: bifunctional riboflavin kinase/FAD synthetase [Calditrichaeota bacterium]|nr:bifunctional riboflavin kinase/FAD synthetase [Calditrichota bacterium]